MFGFMMKLKMVKWALIQWNRNKVDNVSSREKVVNGDLDRVQSML